MRNPFRDARRGERESAARPSRLRRAVRAGAVPLLLSVIAGIAVLAWVTVGADEAGELSEAQWERVLRQMSGRSRTVSADADADATEPATEAGDGDAPAGGEPIQAEPVNHTAADVPQPRGQRLPPPELDADTLARQAAEYDAPANKSIIELQPFRTSESHAVQDGAGRTGTATLLNLNPRVNSWYLLRIAWQDEDQPRAYHLTNAAPAAQSLVLQPEFPFGIVLTGTASTIPCDLWSHDNPRRLEAAAARNTPYVMLCDEKVTLRLLTTGHRTAVERVTDFLRDSIWGGEALTVFVREQFFQDAFLSTAELAGPANGGDASRQAEDTPLPARLEPAAEGRRLGRSDLGLSLADVPRGGPAVGLWYPLRDNPGAFASTMQPDLAAAEILASHTDIVVRLDEVESGALAYLAAFDLSAFDVAFALGTDHPRLGWSDRVPEERRDATIAGPDGFDMRSPLVSTGIIPGSLAARSVATFTGGFKRSHGAFRYGDLMLRNNGSHYGFIEEGVAFSKLQPGLSTIYVLDDGTFAMKTWETADNALLDRIRYARQNGVPIIERRDGGEGPGVPGAMVSRYGAGNWSGSQEGKYRTLRAGACLQHAGERTFLIYAYFSSATPSAMARVFQAYSCTYAMLLDMNALEHTYMAVYALRGSELSVEHLVRGMEVLDKADGERLLPRFLGFADNRDFFYLLRREPAATTTNRIGS